jgi:type I restriction enzyme S subunit
MKPYPKYKDSGVEWIGEVPEHWSLIKLKYLFRWEKGANAAVYTNNYISFHSGDFPVYSGQTENDGILGCIESFDYDFRNKILFVTTVGAKAMSLRIISGRFSLSQNCALIIPKNSEESSASYYFYYLQRLFAYEKSSISLIMQPSLRFEDLNQYSVFFFPFSEQTAIANYLDRKTAEIDRLIANKEGLIELYGEEKTAVINQAVTKGLDPDVTMKPSGIDLLGDIPERWEVKRLKYLTKIFRGKFGHRPRNDERLYGGVFPFIQTGEVTNSNKYIEQYWQTLNEQGYAVCQEFPAGTLVMTIAANIGDVAILNFNACFPDSIIGFFPREEITVDFLYYTLVSLKNVLIGAATQNTQQNLNIERVGQIEISYPPKDEQTAIVQYIETQCSRLDTIIAKFKKQIELLKEYRTTLISEVVTGKIDVRDEGLQ